jgi:hypothetical protein
MPTAEELFTETFRRFNNNWNVINSIRQFLAVTGSIAPVAMRSITPVRWRCLLLIPTSGRSSGKSISR